MQTTQVEEDHGMRQRQLLFRDCRGVSSIEYALLASFIALGLGTALQETGSSVAGSLNGADAGLSGTGASADTYENEPSGKGKGRRNPRTKRPG